MSTETHVDGFQLYRGGAFRTPSEYGHEPPGSDPDEADYAHLDHVENYEVPIDPADALGCDSCQ